MAKLLRNFGSLEIPAERCVVHAVVGSELAQAFPGRPSSHQFRVGDKPAQRRPYRAWAGLGGGIVLDRAHQNGWIDRASDIGQRAQAGRLDYALQAAASCNCFGR
jgi:hypothetical protein